jgi:molybdate transport system ATP-binding protein
MRARIRARDVMLALDRPERISALNVIPATVASVTAAPEAADALVRLDAGGDRLLARVTRQTVAALALAPGTPVWAIVKAVAFDRANAPGRTPLSGA